MRLDVALKNCLARVTAAAVLGPGALAVWWPREVEGAGVAGVAAAAEIVAVGAAGADGMRMIEGPYPVSVRPSEHLSSRRLIERPAQAFRFPRGIEIPILNVPRCLCFPATPGEMPLALS